MQMLYIDVSDILFRLASFEICSGGSRGPISCEIGRDHKLDEMTAADRLTKTFRGFPTAYIQASLARDLVQLS